MHRPSNDVYEFGPFRLDAGQRVLTCEHQRVPLAPKTFDLLLLLAGTPGRAFSKEELMTALWPDTFVEEANLSFQITRLRKGLGDRGAAWIETVPKHGYRFAADVVTNGAVGTMPAVLPAEIAAAPPTPTTRSSGWRYTSALFAGLVVVAAVYLAFVGLRPARPHDSSDPIVVPLTTYPGSETGPSLSPDGTQVAFSWDGPNEDNADVYIKLVGLGEPVRLTTAPERDESPAWSPDGRRIAFVRRLPGRGCEMMVIPALGGAERRVASFVLDSARRSSALSWSPDGKWVAVGGQLKAADPFGIFLVEIDGSETRRLTVPPSPDWLADFAPVFSADGGRLAFIRSKAMNNAIFILPLSPALAAAGDPVQVLSDPRKTIAHVAWTADGRGLVYSWGGHVAPTRLERVDVLPDSKGAGVPHVLPFGERAIRFAIGRTGRMVYSALLREANFWKLDVAQPAATPVFAGLSPSTLHEETPAFSPDGRQVVFTSTRSGSEELWISSADGTNVRQMTSMGGPQCANPDWARDGQSILFNSTRDGTSDLYLLFPGTGEIRRLTSDPAEELEAHWSRDGQSIYFGSNRSGRFEIWKVRADGSAPAQVTRSGGQSAQESPDGRSLYYARNGSPTTIWRLSLDTGHDVQLVDGVSYPNNFVVGDRGVYFLAVGDSATQTSIDLFEFATERRVTLARVGKPLWSGVALSPGQRWLVFSTLDRDGSDLMLVDPGR